MAPKPTLLIPEGLLSEGAINWVASAKYLDGLPLYRHPVLPGRFGGTDITHSTLAGSIVRKGLSVQPDINLIRDLLLEPPVVYGDDTKHQVLKETGLNAQICARSGADGTALAQPMYAGIRTGGVLMTVGYDPYSAITQTFGLVHLGYWAHFRRYFNDGLQALPKARRGQKA